MKKLSLKAIAKIIDGDLSGKGNPLIERITSPDEAKKGDLVFIFEHAPSPKIPASAFVVQGEKIDLGKPCIFVKNGRLALAKLLPLFAPAKKAAAGIHQTAVIGKKVKLGKSVSIGPYTVIEEGCSIGDRTFIGSHTSVGANVEIGKECTIHPHVSIYADTIIGNRVILHCGAVIGVDGFGYAPEGEKFIKIPQIGKVVIEDEVEIYANTTVARGTLGPTLIKKGTKIDCLSQIAHNCKIGENCVFASLIGLAGSVEVGRHVQVGGMAGFKDHTKVGDGVIVAAKAGVTKDIPANAVVSGFPAANHQQDLEIQAFMRRLPELYQRVAALEKK